MYKIQGNQQGITLMPVVRTCIYVRTYSEYVRTDICTAVALYSLQCQCYTDTSSMYITIHTYVHTYVHMLMGLSTFVTQKS